MPSTTQEGALADLARWLRVEAGAFRKTVMYWDSASPSALPPIARSPPGIKAEYTDYLERIDFDAQLREEMGEAAEDPVSAPAGLTADDILDMSLLDASRAMQGLVDSRVARLSGGRDAPADAEADDEESSFAEFCALPALQAQADKTWRPRPIPPWLDCQSAVLATSVPISRRRRLWECSSALFHPEVLVQPCGLLSPKLVDSLRTVFHHYKPLLFCTRPGDVIMWSQPPPEMFEQGDFDAVRNSYCLLRNTFIPELLQQSEAAAAFEVTHAVVLLDTGALAKIELGHLACPSAPEVPDFTDQSLALGRDSCLGRSVEVKGGVFKGQAVEIRSFVKHVIEDKLYALLMSRSYASVSASGVWSSLRLYHRIIVAAGTTEGFAETVFSMCSIHVRGMHGQKKTLGDVLCGVKLRAAGVTGEGQDWNFIRRSLDIYFRRKPWHFRISERATRERDPLYKMVSLAVAHCRENMARRFTVSWLLHGLRALLLNSGRRSLIKDCRVAWGPRAGSEFLGCASARQLQAELASIIKSLQPDVLDKRVREWL